MMKEIARYLVPLALAMPAELTPISVMDLWIKEVVDPYY